jgi:hypothetical protein
MNVVATVVGLLVLCALCVAPSMRTVFALGSRNVEIVFIVYDGNTAEPIEGAEIDVRVERRFDEDDEITLIKRTTDEHGKATLFRKDNWVEEVIRPFRKTLTLYDFTWCSFSVNAVGFRKLENMWLHTAGFVDRGYVAEGRFQRIELTIPMERLNP